MTQKLDEAKFYGYAIYFEVKTLSGTHHQFLLTPPVTSHINRTERERSVLYRRALHPSSSARRHWRVATPMYSDVSSAPPSLASRMDHITRIANRLLSTGASVVHQPLVVEVSAADAATIKTQRTPYKVLGRVERVKKALGLPGMPGKS